MPAMGRCPSSVSCLFFLALSVVAALGRLGHAYTEYCIVGAGPSGLQMGYFFERGGKDYIIFERSNISGNTKNMYFLNNFGKTTRMKALVCSFYAVYPRHRKLISVNKRWTGKTNKEFHLRHDWNSLLSDVEQLRMTRYSREMFPPADVLLDYLNDYQRKLGLNVQFNTEIRNIQKEPCESVQDKQIFTMVDQNGNNYRCGKLIIATGIAKPYSPDIPGHEHIEGYETLSINRDDYEGQSVLILGRGNSAFETANHIYGLTRSIHMVGRSRVRLSWATHYVGDLRAINNDLLDTYQLKSLDGLLEASISDIAIVKSAEGKLYLKIREGMEGGETKDELSDNFAMREPYDRIIRCLGFSFDGGIFNESMKLSRPKGRGKKYPSIHHNYESVDHRGMFVAGTAAHSLDYRKSAGGFIHGFRYTARALYRLLEWRYHGVKWPSTSAPHSQLVTHILRRINEASGIFQMSAMLDDVIILNDDNATYTYLEEFPIHLIHKLTDSTGHPASQVIVINLQYGAGYSGPASDVFRLDRATGDPSEAHQSNFLHPCLYYYKKLPSEAAMKHLTRKEHLPRPHMIHHIVEDFLMTWDGSVSHVLPLRRFIENVFDVDMRRRFAETCMLEGLTHTDTSTYCEEFYMQDQGLSESSVFITAMKKAT